MRWRRSRHRRAACSTNAAGISASRVRWARLGWLAAPHSSHGSRDTSRPRGRAHHGTLDKCPVAASGASWKGIVSYLDEHRAAAHITPVHLAWRGIDLTRSTARKAIHAVAHRSAGGWQRGGQLHLGDWLPCRRPRRPYGRQNAQAWPGFVRQRHRRIMRSHARSRLWPAAVARVVDGLASRPWVSFWLCPCLYLLRGRPCPDSLRNELGSHARGCRATQTPPRRQPTTASGSILAGQQGFINIHLTRC
jgi:hypothetical protein